MLRRARCSSSHCVTHLPKCCIYKIIQQVIAVQTSVVSFRQKQISHCSQKTEIFDTVLVLFKVFDTEFRLEERFDLV